MWVKFPQSTVVSGQKAILSSARQGTETTFGGVEFLIVNGILRVHFKQSWGNKRWRVQSNITEQYNKWMHITGTWSAHGFVYLYINGTLKATQSEGTYPVGSATPNMMMTVGKFNSGSEKYGQFDLDEWYVWDRQLNSDQVVQVYATYLTGSKIILYFFLIYNTVG